MVTADQNIPPMGGLALMAMRLAGRRLYDWEIIPQHVVGPVSRKAAGRYPAAHPFAFEYYKIIDCITNGHQWRAEKEFASCGRCHATKAMRDFKPGEYHRGR
jgi:hypothetical protein